jgi:hypothetical protein
MTGLERMIDAWFEGRRWRDVAARCDARINFCSSVSI